MTERNKNGGGDGGIVLSLFGVSKDAGKKAPTISSRCQRGMGNCLRLSSSFLVRQFLPSLCMLAKVPNVGGLAGDRQWVWVSINAGAGIGSIVSAVVLRICGWVVERWAYMMLCWSYMLECAVGWCMDMGGAEYDLCRDRCCSCELLGW
jgi:hypothetical protein